MFFSSWKNFLKSWLDASSIPCCLSSFFSFFLSQSQQLLDTWWINQKWFCILDSFLTPGGSIELLFLFLLGCSSTPHRYLNCWRPLSRHLPRQMSWHLHLSRFTDALFKLLVRSEPHFVRSLPQYFSVFSPKLSHLTPIFVPQGFFKFFSCFSSLGKLLILSYSRISCFET